MVIWVIWIYILLRSRSFRYVRFYRRYLYTYRSPMVCNYVGGILRSHCRHHDLSRGNIFRRKVGSSKKSSYLYGTLSPLQHSPHKSWSPAHYSLSLGFSLRTLCLTLSTLQTTCLPNATSSDPSSRLWSLLLDIIALAIWSLLVSCLPYTKDKKKRPDFQPLPYLFSYDIFQANLILLFGLSEWSITSPSVITRA